MQRSIPPTSFRKESISLDVRSSFARSPRLTEIAHRIRIRSRRRNKGLSDSQGQDFPPSRSVVTGVEDAGFQRLDASAGERHEIEATKRVKAKFSKLVKRQRTFVVEEIRKAEDLVS